MLDDRFDEAYGDLYQETKHYPDVMPFVLSHAEFPVDYSQMCNTGMPFGFTLTPFLRISADTYIDARVTDTKSVARCQNCHAYINSACDANRFRWICALCLKRNTFDTSNTTAKMVTQRYSSSSWRGLKELSESVFDVALAPEDDPQRVQTGEEEAGQPPIRTQYNRSLLHLFVLDLSMEEDALLMAVEGLTAAMTTIHPDMHVLFVTIAGDAVQLYRVAAGKTPPPECFSTTKPFPRAEVGAFFAGLHPVGSNFEKCVSVLGGLVGKGGQARSQPLTMVLDRLLRWFTGRPDKAGGGTTADTDGTIGALSSGGLPGVLDGGGGKGLVDRAVTGLMGFASALSSALVGVDDDGAEQDNSCDFADEHVGILPQTMNEGAAAAPSGGEGEAGPSSADAFSGTMVHVFTSSLSPTCNSASSLPSSTFTQSSPPNDVDMAALVEICAANGTAVHVWVASNGGPGRSEVAVLLPLVTRTGGTCTKIKVGQSMDAATASMERSVVTEKLRRTFTTPVATRCMLRIRASPAVQLGDKSGPGMEDRIIPNLWHIPMSTPDSTIGATVLYHDAPEVQPSARGDAIALQMSFSYEVLMDASGRLTCPLGDSGDDAAAGSAVGLGRDADWTALMNQVDCCVGMASESGETQAAATDAARRGVDVWIGPGSSGQYARCFYSGTEQLRCVRRLRIATVFIKCNTHHAGLVRALAPSVTGAVIARTVYHTLLDSGALSGRKDPVDVLESIQAAVTSIENWAVSVMAAAARPVLRAALLQENMADPDTSKSLIAFDAVARTQSFGQIRALLQALFGASRILVSEVLPAIVDVSALPADRADRLARASATTRQVTGTDSAAGRDDLCETLTKVQTTRPCDTDKVLYPKLYALNEDACICSGPEDALPTLPLTSLSLQTMSFERTGFLLDAGSDILVCVPPAAPQAVSGGDVPLPYSVVTTDAPPPRAAPVTKPPLKMPLPPGMTAVAPAPKHVLPLPPTHLRPGISASFTAPSQPPQEGSPDVEAETKTDQSINKKNGVKKGTKDGPRAVWRSCRWLLNDLRRRFFLAPDGSLPRVRYSRTEPVRAFGSLLWDDIPRPLVTDFHQWTGDIQDRVVREII